ncbi:MAG: chromate transporter [Spirochaetaceae bacterium]|nr:chromate transporter [Spirochaetaceae bacterium]
MLYLSLFWEFFKIGLFALGGGLATIPFLYQLTINFPTWISNADVANMIAISQSTPGPMGVNMATYTGFKVIGILGGLTATIGLVSPSVLIVILISKFLKHFDQKWYVKDSFYGLRPTVLALITYAVSNIFALSLFNYTKIRVVESIIFLAIFILYRKFEKIHPIIWILVGAILGIVLKLPK